MLLPSGGFAMGQDRFKLSALYPGSVAHFRVLMIRLVAQVERTGWVSAGDCRLHLHEHREIRRELVAVEPLTAEMAGQVVYGGTAKYYRKFDATPPGRASWQVELEGSAAQAGIEAYEQPGAQTAVDFLDGYSPVDRLDREPIGAAFEELAHQVVGLFPGKASGGRELPAWVPRMPRSRKKWQQAYALMVSLAKQYHKQANEEWTRDQPAPKLNEFADYIALKIKWKPSEKTIGRIRQAGENGWLDP